MTTSPLFTLRLPVLLVLVATAPLCGCGGVGDVAGKVTCNGKPVQVGTVVVLGSDSLPYTAAIEITGDYRVEGVPTGTAKFAIVSLDPKTHTRKVDGSIRMKAPPIPTMGKWFPIPERYREPTKSEIYFNVQSGQNQFDIVLTDDKTPEKKPAQ